MTAYDNPERLRTLYRMRFSDPTADETRRVTWQVLCAEWFPTFIRSSDVVLELGAGKCDFINNIQAARKIAVDLNPDAANAVGPDVEFLQQSASDLADVTSGSVDVVFSSNFFEHLGSADNLLAVLAESWRVLRPGGRSITLMPNIAALGGKYFDFLDHTLPLTDVSLAEALSVSGFKVELSIPRFLPYTTVGRRRVVRPIQVRAYLAARPAWRVLGRQMFVVAAKTA